MRKEQTADELRQQIVVLANKLSEKKSRGIIDYPLAGKIIQLQKKLFSKVYYENLSR